MLEFTSLTLNFEVVADHFLYLAKLLLTAHDPSIPRIGPRMKSALAEMKVSDQACCRRPDE